jgi:16S rRNA (guanine527-N7)-methyltransferase
MTEEEARAWFVTHFGGSKAARVGTFLAWVTDENTRQNLVSPATLDVIWSRHGVDSAQLLFHVEQSTGAWLDIGTGGGFPGMVVALLFDGPVTMVEPRRKRADFLQSSVDRLGIPGAQVRTQKVEQVTGQYAVISARAVASVEKLLQAAEHCATPETRWILPRGRIEDGQMATLQRDQSRVFHVEHSLTDPQSSILIVDRKGKPAR